MIRFRLVFAVSLMSFVLSNPAAYAAIGPATAATNKPILMAQQATEPAGGRIEFQRDNVDSETREQFEQGFEFTQPEAESEAEAPAESGESDAELEAARLEAEKARAEAEALKAELEEQKRQREAAERAAEEARREAEAAAQAEAEAKRQQDAAREAEAAARAEAEAAAAAARTEAEAEEARRRAEQELAERRAPAVAPDPEPAPEPEAAVAAGTGSLSGVTIDANAVQDGVEGVAVTLSGSVEGFNETLLESAVYFHNAQGDPLRDSDQNYRSASGQVYVGSYRTADGDPYRWSESIFIPANQLDLQRGGEHTLNAEVILWEYSSRRGKGLTRTGLLPFKYEAAPIAPDRKRDLNGAWSDGISIQQSPDRIWVQGLHVRGTVQDARWSYVDDVLVGTVEARRRIGSTRVYEYTLRMAENGGELAGTVRVTNADGEEIEPAVPIRWIR